MLWVRVDTATPSNMIFPDPLSRFGAVVEKDICVNMVAQLLTASWVLLNSIQFDTMTRISAKCKATNLIRYVERAKVQLQIAIVHTD